MQQPEDQDPEDEGFLFPDERDDQSGKHGNHPDSQEAGEVDGNSAEAGFEADFLNPAPEDEAEEFTETATDGNDWGLGSGGADFLEFDEDDERETEAAQKPDDGTGEAEREASPARDFASFKGEQVEADLPPLDAPLEPQPAAPAEPATEPVDSSNGMSANSASPVPPSAATEVSVASDEVTSTSSSPDEGQEPQDDKTIAAQPVSATSRSSRPMLVTIAALLLLIVTVTLVLPLLIRQAGSEFIPDTATLEAREESENKVFKPVDGRLVRIIGTDTGWRYAHEHPEGDGPQSLVPELTLEFEADEARPEGALRILFSNEVGHLASQSFNPPVRGGRIVSGDEPSTSLTLQGSEGLRDQSNLVLQSARSGMRWRAEIYEGPHPQAPFAEFQKILQVPIDPIIKEPETE